MLIKLKDLGEIITGNTPSKKEISFWDSEDIRFVKPDIISDAGISKIEETGEYLSENARSKARIVKKDTIFVTCIGSIGKVGIASDGDYAFNQQINAIVPNKLVVARYLAYALLQAKPRLEAIANAPVVPIINKSQFGEFLINIEKDRIKQQYVVEKLDLLDEIISTRKKEIVLLDSLIKARFVELFGDPLINPKGYPVKPMSSIAEYWNGLTYKPEDVSEKGTVVLRSSNIQNMQLDFSDTVRVSCNIGEKKFVNNNDILMCSRNGSAKLVGKVALIHDLNEPMSFGAFMMIIRSDYYPYLMTYFQLPAFRSQITTGATTTINQITGGMMNKVMLPVPDRPTINEFAAFVDQIYKSKLQKKKSKR